VEVALFYFILNHVYLGGAEKMPPRRDPYAFATVTPTYAKEIELRQDIQEMQKVAHSTLATSGQRKEARKRLKTLVPLYEAAKVATTETPKFYEPPAPWKPTVIPPKTNGEKKMALAGLQIPDWIQDIIGGIDVLLPEELLGIDITPGVAVGAEKKGRVLYDNVWIEDGKVKVVRKGTLRVLGYTPQEAKKRFKTRRRRKRLTKRDIYIIEALKDGASPAAIAIL
jgi:hypothetical protein